MIKRRILVHWGLPLAVVIGLLSLGIVLQAAERPSGPTCWVGPQSLGLLQGTTYYVRPDGGSPEQCTGLVDAPYPGSGTGQPCAWDHPFRALQPSGEHGVPGTVRISGGDTLIIAPGSYRIGYGAPGAENCSPDYPWDCVMPPIPSGPDSQHPTRILGSSGSDPPELWGTERATMVLNLSGSSNVEIACLEITDHSSCVEFHTGSLTCNRDSYPYGPWASWGIHAEDSANVRLRSLNIHGLAHTGVHAGRLTDWVVEDVRIAGNGWVGWDGDIDGDDANLGTMRFRRWTVEWNGCGETYPGGQPTGCWAQTAGGYGDGVGTGTTGGHWIIEDSAFLHNTSDGLDLLYTRLPGSLIEIRRTKAEGNAGNQIKTNGPTLIENSILVGNCGYFEGQPFTFNVDACRAYGNALSLSLRPGDQVTVTNCTLASEGDCLVVADCEGSCDGSESVLLRNNIFQGHTDFLQPDDITCLAYQETFPRDPFDFDYSLIAGVKDDACPGVHDICGVSPGLVSTVIDSFDAHLRSNSSAINAGTSAGAPADDFDSRQRDARPDIGAYEWWERTNPVYLPLILGVRAFGYSAGGWTSQNKYPRFAGDVNGDGLADVVGFGNAGVYVSLSTGSAFGPPALWLRNFGYAQGWTSGNTHPRCLADVNGDGRADVVGFFHDGVYVSCSTGTGLSPPICWIARFGVAQGWSSQDKYPRTLGDVDGDGRADVVGFFSDGGYVSHSNGVNSFGTPTRWIAGYGYSVGNWTSQDKYPRHVADVNGDGRADVVGFGNAGVYVSLSTGSAFASSRRWIVGFGYSAGGWTSQNLSPRLLADANADGKADIIGFGKAGANVSLSTGTSFASPTLGIASCGQSTAAGGWSSQDKYPRAAADVNLDHKTDIVGFANAGTFISFCQ